MLCQLDDFQFETNQTDLSQINTESEYTFERNQTISSFDVVTAVGQYTQKHSLAGMLIRKSIHTFEALERIAERKKPITLTFDSGKAYQVVITNIRQNKSLFLNNGIHLKNDFEVQLERVNA
ncbi:MAG: phage tail protein [Shewanella sp.]